MAILRESLVLASASPRRREILEGLGIPFVVDPSGVEEKRGAGEAASDYALRLAEDKAHEVATRHPTGVVLGADTVVVVDGDVLEKPVDDLDAQRMLLRLSGRGHEVVTGVALVRAGRAVLARRAAVTRVRFRSVSMAEAARYAATGEGRDKAGGYAVQGLAGGFVESIDGSYHNVVGLPAADVIEMLLRCDILAEWP